MKKITNIIIFILSFLVIYTGSGFVEINFNCSKCGSSANFYEKLLPTVKKTKAQGKCTCGCGSGSSCSKGGCSCSSKKALAKKNNTDKETKGQAQDCAKYIFNKFDLKFNTSSVLIPQQLAAPVFFDYNPLAHISLMNFGNMMFETHNKGPIQPLLSRFILNLYCTLLI